MRSSLITVTVILGLICSATSYKILALFPHPGSTHFFVFQPIMKGLADAGHEVTVVSHFPEKVPINNYIDMPLEGMKSLANSIDLNMFKDRPSYIHFLEFFMLYDWGLQACENALNSPAINKILESKVHYDLVVVEQFNTDCMLGVAHKLQAPYIGLSSCNLMPWHHDRLGNPIMPSYIPALFMGYSEKMDFSQRLANWVTTHGMKIMYKYFNSRAANQILQKKFGSDMPDMAELQKKTSMMFVNTHFSLSGPKPWTPAVLEVGGVHIQKFNQLEPELQMLLDTADNGVIYISWGSMIRAETLPDEKRNAILQALGSFKQRVIWKWENDSLPNQPSNVFIRKWLPQKEILCHPKTRVFMSHGGLLGTSEAAYCGIPTIFTPMYGDQFLNAAAMENRGMGFILEYEKITRELVHELLTKALDQNTIENAKKVSYSYKNRIQTPLKSAIWWAEYVAATGGATLTKSYSTEMSWYAYYCLDIYLFLFCILSVTIGSWVWVIMKFCRKNSPSATGKLKVQ